MGYRITAKEEAIAARSAERSEKEMLRKKQYEHGLSTMNEFFRQLRKIHMDCDEKGISYDDIKCERLQVKAWEKLAKKYAENIPDNPYF